MCVLKVQNVGGKMGTSTSNTLKVRYAVSNILMKDRIEESV
jgi:hypothetical protein